MALLREADAVDKASRAALPTPEEERVIIDAADTLAGSEAGVPAKSRAVVLRLESKWCNLLERHGEEYGWDERVGPTMEMAKHFQTWFSFSSDQLQHGRAGWHGRFMGSACGALPAAKVRVSATRLRWLGRAGRRGAAFEVQAVRG